MNYSVVMSPMGKLRLEVCGPREGDVRSTGFFTEMRALQKGAPNHQWSMEEEGTTEKRHTTRGQNCTILPRFPVPKTRVCGRTRVDLDSAGFDWGHCDFLAVG